jgi:DNA-binding transcriptional LysR family regulator
VEIDLAVENRDRVIARLHRQADDLAVMMLPPDELPLHSLPFLANPLVVIAPRSHPLAAIQRPIALAELTQERWLMREVGSGTRLVAERHFADHGFAPRIAMSLGSNEALKHAVGAGLGLAVVSQLAVGATADPTTAPAAKGRRSAPQPPWVSLPVESFPIERQWSLVWRRDVPLSAPARQLVTYLQTSLAATLPRSPTP